jgi:uncharacterized membrane protein (DUF373 family)
MPLRQSAATLPGPGIPSAISPLYRPNLSSQTINFKFHLGNTGPQVKFPEIPSTQPYQGTMELIIGKIEKYISFALIFVGLTFACYQTIELVYLFVVGLFDSVREGRFMADQPGRPIAGLFFSVLLTLELIATIRVFAHDQLVKIRIILLVGLIAVTRKILEMDMDHIAPVEGLTVAALILTLSLSYYLVSRSEGQKK